nr:MAK10-like protein [Tanacetum cinerariifolium]
MENLYQKHGLISRTYYKKSLILALTFGSKSNFFTTMSILSQDEPLTNRLVDFTKPVKAITFPQDVPSTLDRCLIELENQFQRLMEAHLAPTQPTQVNKVITSYEIYSGLHDTQNCMEGLNKLMLNTHPLVPIKREQSDSYDEKEKKNEEKEKDSPENIHVNPSMPPDPSVSFITKKVLKFNSFFESLGLVPQSFDIEVVCTKGDDGEVMFIEIIRKNDESHEKEPEEWKSPFAKHRAFRGNTRNLGSFGEETDKTTDLHQHLSRLYSQRLETASQDTRDAVTIHPMTVSQESMTVSARTTQPKI